MDNLKDMGTSQALQHASQEAGWDLSYQVEVLLRYIEQQQDHDAFADYLAFQLDEEESLTEED